MPTVELLRDPTVAPDFDNDKRPPLSILKVMREEAWLHLQKLERLASVAEKMLRCLVDAGMGQSPLADVAREEISAAQAQVLDYSPGGGFHVDRDFIPHWKFDGEPERGHLAAPRGRRGTVRPRKHRAAAHGGRQEVRSA